MHRLAALAATLVATAVVLAPAASAQSQRPFPANALRGEIVVQQPPEVLLNGRAARLSPGSRIRGEDNMLVMSGAAAGQRLLVHYTVDAYGLVHDVWILTPSERAKRPWPTTPEEAARWSFDPVAQAWTKP